MPIYATTPRATAEEYHGFSQIELVDDQLVADLLDYVEQDGANGFEDVALIKVPSDRWYFFVSLHFSDATRKYFSLFRTSDPVLMTNLEYLGKVFTEEPQSGERISDAWIDDGYVYISYDKDRETYVARTPLDGFPDTISWEQVLYIPKGPSGSISETGVFQPYLLRRMDRILVLRTAVRDASYKYNLAYHYVDTGSWSMLVTDYVKAVGGLNIDDWTSKPTHSERGVYEPEPGLLLTAYEILRSDGKWRIGLVLHRWREHYPVALKDKALIIEHSWGIANPNEIRILNGLVHIWYNERRHDTSPGFPAEWMGVLKIRLIRG